MLCRRFQALLVAVLCAFPARLSQAQDEELRPAALAAIARAQQFLIASQAADGSWEYSGHTSGATALVVMSLIYSGMPTDAPAVRRGLDFLRLEPIPDNVYDVSLMAMALSLSGDSAYVGRLKSLADWLVRAQHKEGDPGPGAWGYREGNEGHWDNSNTQFAILGLREAVHGGADNVPREVWQRSQTHFLQHKSGSTESVDGVTFYYSDGSRESRGSMQVAGISSLMITSSMLDDDRNVRAGGEIDCCAPVDDEAHQTIEAACRWLGRNFSVKENPGANSQWHLYYLYGLERAGRFTGRRFLGPPESPKDWYRLGVRTLVPMQNVVDGSWFDSGSGTHPAMGTALALMFISKGNSPVMINKLRYGDPQGELYGRGWNRQPRDASNLTDYISTRPRWPRLLSWQTVDLGVAAREQDGASLLQAKVQLLTGDGPLDTLSDAEVDLLREYIHQGGFLLAVNTCGGNEFDAAFRRLVQKMFPDGDQKLVKLPPTHDVYRSETLLSPEEAGEALELWGVDLGCRTAIMYAPYDHCCRWNKWMHIDPPKRDLAVKTQIKRSMELGANIIAYATGRELLDALTEPERLVSVDADSNRRGRLEIARLRHLGGWDTAPSAVRHLQLALGHVGIETTPDAPNLAATDPALADYPVLYMHGRKNFRISAAEQAALRTYLDQGGFLFADACCGEKQFDDSFRTLVRELYNRELEPIPLDHPLFNSELGHDVREVRRRLPLEGGAAATLQSEYRLGPPVLEGITDSRGRYVLVYSKYDLSCALERQATVNCAGYASEDAARIATNIVIYALSQ